MDIVAVRCAEKMLDVLAGEGGGREGIACTGTDEQGRGWEGSGRREAPRLRSCWERWDASSEAKDAFRKAAGAARKPDAVSAPPTHIPLCPTGKLASPAAWAGEVPSSATACCALRRALPVLRDLLGRAVSEVGAWPASSACWLAGLRASRTGGLLVGQGVGAGACSTREQGQCRQAAGCATRQCHWCIPACCPRP